MQSRNELIKTLHAQGMSQRAISRQVGISQPAVHKQLLKMGLLTPHYHRSDEERGGNVPNNESSRSSETSVSVKTRAASPVSLQEQREDASLAQPVITAIPSTTTPTTKAVSIFSPPRLVSVLANHGPLTQKLVITPHPPAWGSPTSFRPVGRSWCSQCQRWFRPKRQGQKYCCNGCGHKANGEKPLQCHTEECTRMSR